MTRSIGISHTVREADGTAVGVWGVHAVKSAFQPIFRFVNGRLEVVAFEGLARAFRGEEPVSTAQFFNSVPDVDRSHVETLTRTLHLLNAGRFLDHNASIFVNFDPSLFTRQENVDATLRDMRLVLHEAGIAPERVVCEVTEQAATGALVDRFAYALREAGMRIAVDDYGAEESGIARINALRPDIVKFDAHWIGRLMETAPGQAMLATLVEFFQGRGIETIFEGIEELWQLEAAENAGASMVQGFVLMRPELAPTSFGSLVVRAQVMPESPTLVPAALAYAGHPAAVPLRNAAARTFGRRGL